MPTLVESHDGGNHRRSVQHLRIFLSGKEHHCSIQFVEIKCIGQLQRALLEILIDLVFDILDRNLPYPIAF